MKSVYQRSGALCSAALLVVLGVSCTGGDDETSDKVPVLEVGADAVGTCLLFDDTVTDEIDVLPTIDCAEPHSHEIYAIVESGEPVYPGFDALEANAQADCLGAFEPYVGIGAFDSELFYSWIVPTLTSWDKEDDRETICVAGNSNAAPLVGTIADSQR